MQTVAVVVGIVVVLLVLIGLFAFLMLNSPGVF